MEQLYPTLFNFYLEHGLQFVQFSPTKFFNNLVQSVLDARREGVENNLSGVVAETLKLLGNSSNGYQIMDRSRLTITKYLNKKNSKKLIKQSMSHCSKG